MKMLLLGTCVSRCGVLFLVAGLTVLTPLPAAKAADEVELSSCQPSGLAYQTLAVESQERATFLAGRIVDDAGRPIVGAKVDAFHWYPGSETTTDATGAFRLYNTDPKQAYLTPDEKIEVTFSAPGYTPRYIAAQPLGKLLKPVVLSKDTFLFGTVRDEKGQPVANAKVRAVAGPFEGDGVRITNVPYVTTTDAQGRYKLFLQGDTYELFVLGAKGNSRIPAVALTAHASIEKQITLRPGVTFRAQVVDSLTGKPVPGLRLISESDFNAVSDKGGRIEIPNMYNGLFRWDVQAPGVARWWSEQAAHEYERKSMEEEHKWQRNLDSLSFKIAPDRAAVTIVVERGVRIQGRVLDPEGKPVSGATVAPALTGTGNSLTGDTRYSVRTNAKGEFDGLYPAGHNREWNLIAHDGDYEEWRRWANVSSAPLKTEAGQVIKNFTLTLSRPVVVTGRVVDANGKAVAHAEVRAAQGDKRDNRYYAPTVETDANGRFELRFVSAGQQLIQVEPFWLYASEAPAASTKTIDVKEGNAVDIGTLTQVPVS